MCIKVCNFVTKCCKTHLQAYSNPKIFLGSLLLAMRGKGRKRVGEGKGKGGRGKGDERGREKGKQRVGVRK
jgi:hypothetical protein